MITRPYNHELVSRSKSKCPEQQMRKKHFKEVQRVAIFEKKDHVGLNRFSNVPPQVPGTCFRIATLKTYSTNKLRKIISIKEILQSPWLKMEKSSL